MSAWKGALDLGGFPVNVRLEARRRKTKSYSFKVLAKDGLPPKRKQYDSSGKEIQNDETVRGVQVGKDQFVQLPAEAVEAIKANDRTILAEPCKFVPAESLDLALAEMSYVVIPDKDVPAADRSVNVLWNGLRSTGLAYVSEIGMTAGAMEAIVCIYATEKELRAVALPYGTELYSTPSIEYEEDEKAAKVFAQFVDASYSDLVDSEMKLTDFESDWLKRREETIATVVEGGEIKAVETEAPKPAGADLMAALEGAVKEAGKKKAPAKKRTAKKTTKKTAAKA